MPPRIGYKFSAFAADQIASHGNWHIVRGVRANQWVVCGENLGGEALHQAVRATFRNSALAIFNLYHYVNNPKASQCLIKPDAVTQELIQRPEYAERGLMLLGLHMSNFDLVLQAMCRRGLKAMALTIPDPQGGRRLEYEMRKRIGMNLVPASASTMRQAVRYLQAGGLVLTGIDRPVPQSNCRPKFFGRPSSLPAHHIHLALKSHVPVMVICAIMQPDEKYHVFASDLIEMQPHSDRETEILQNAEKVLNIAEGFIRQAPQQWVMSLPVWPEIVNQIPT